MISVSFACCCQKVFTHGWLGKIQWNFINKEIIIQQSPKYGDITDVDYRDFEIKTLDECHVFHVQSDTIIASWCI